MTAVAAFLMSAPSRFLREQCAEGGRERLRLLVETEELPQAALPIDQEDSGGVVDEVVGRARRDDLIRRVVLRGHPRDLLGGPREPDLPNAVAAAALLERRRRSALRLDGPDRLRQVRP